MEDVRIEHRYNASNFKLGNHHENVYQMLLITNGRIRYRVGSKTYETGRGGVIVLNTLEEHDLEVLDRHGFKDYFGCEVFAPYEDEPEKAMLRYLDWCKERFVQD